MEILMRQTMLQLGIVIEDVTNGKFVEGVTLMVDSSTRDELVDFPIEDELDIIDSLDDCSIEDELGIIDSLDDPSIEDELDDASAMIALKNNKN